MPVLSHRKPCPCYYCVLDLPNVTPSQTEITKAFKNMARICHPDKVPEAHKQAAHEQFCNVQKAHSVLGDASLRKGYDLDQMPKYYSAMDFQQDPKDHGKYGRNPQKKQYTSPAPPPPPRPRGKYTDTPDVDPDLWESPPKPRPAPKYRSSTDPYGGPGAKAQHDRRGKSVWGREDPNDEAIEDEFSESWSRSHSHQQRPVDERRRQQEIKREEEKKKRLEEKQRAAEELKQKHTHSLNGYTW